MPETNVIAPGGVPAKYIGNNTFMFHVAILPVNVTIKVNKTVQTKVINATYDTYNCFCDGKALFNSVTLYIHSFICIMVIMSCK